MMSIQSPQLLLVVGYCLVAPLAASASDLPSVDVEAQPLAANIRRLVQALDFIGAPLPADLQTTLQKAGDARDAKKLQELLDQHVWFVVTLDKDTRAKVSRGPAKPILQQAGFTPAIVKVVNQPEVTKPLRISSPQAGPVYAGVAKLSMERQGQTQLRENENAKGENRFLHVEMFTSQPLTPNLSGLKVEYALALIYSRESGKREATVGFAVGEDKGAGGEVGVPFEIRPAIPVKLSILDFDGQQTTGRFTFRDKTGRVYPPQAKRLAPDLFFQQHIYRKHGDTVLLPPGEFIMHYSRGPEYRLLERKVTIPDKGDAAIAVKLDRWFNAADF